MSSSSSYLDDDVDSLEAPSSGVVAPRPERNTATTQQQVVKCSCSTPWWVFLLVCLMILLAFLSLNLSFDSLSALHNTLKQSSSHYDPRHVIVRGAADTFNQPAEDTHAQQTSEKTTNATTPRVMSASDVSTSKYVSIEVPPHDVSPIDYYSLTANNLTEIATGNFPSPDDAEWRQSVHAFVVPDADRISPMIIFCPFGRYVQLLDASWGASFGYDWRTGHIYRRACDRPDSMELVLKICSPQLEASGGRECTFPVRKSEFGEPCRDVPESFQSHNFKVTWRCPNTKPERQPLSDKPPPPSRPSVAPGNDKYPTDSQQISDIAVPVKVPKHSDRGLFVYLMYNSGDVYYNNFLFFVDCCIRDWHQMDYVILVNDNPERPFDANTWPKLPKNGRYLVKSNNCLDYGSVGELLRKQAKITDKNDPWYLDLESYAWFFQKNSGCIGPILPPHLEQSYEPMDLKMTWYYHYQRKFIDNWEIKVAGVSASCEIAPHISGWFLAYDRVGWDMMRAYEPGYRCIDGDVQGVIEFSEVHSCSFFIKNGYNLASNQRVYEDFDFRLPQNSHCQGWDGRNQIHLFPVEGTDIYLDMLELQFVKYKGVGDGAANTYKRSQPFLDWFAQGKSRKQQRNDRLKQRTDVWSQAPPVAAP